jgi:hypothetical protein
MHEEHNSSVSQINIDSSLNIIDDLLMAVPQKSKEWESINRDLLLVRALLSTCSEAL